MFLSITIEPISATKFSSISMVSPSAAAATASWKSHVVLLENKEELSRPTRKKQLKLFGIRQN